MSLLALVVFGLRVASGVVLLLVRISAVLLAISAVSLAISAVRLAIPGVVVVLRLTSSRLSALLDLNLFGIDASLQFTLTSSAASS